MRASLRTAGEWRAPLFWPADSPAGAGATAAGAGVDEAAAAGAGAARAGGGTAGVGASCGAVTSFAATGGAAAAGAAAAAAAGAGAGASPTAKISHTGAPTGTVAPSSARIVDSVPANGDGISDATLSVSTSSSGSYLATCSPGFLSHRPTVPSVTVSPSCGISTCGTILFGRINSTAPFQTDSTAPFPLRGPSQ